MTTPLSQSQSRSQQLARRMDAFTKFIIQNGSVIYGTAAIGWTGFSATMADHALNGGNKGQAVAWGLYQVNVKAAAVASKGKVRSTFYDVRS